MSDTDNPNARFGENTIERAFSDDVEIAMETDGSVPVEVADEQYDVELLYITLGEWDHGSVTVAGTEHDLVEMSYTLVVHEEIDVGDPRRATVDGHQYEWTFENIGSTTTDHGWTSMTAERIGKELLGVGDVTDA